MARIERGGPYRVWRDPLQRADRIYGKETRLRKHSAFAPFREPAGDMVRPAKRGRKGARLRQGTKARGGGYFWNLAQPGPLEEGLHVLHLIDKASPGTGRGLCHRSQACPGADCHRY